MRVSSYRTPKRTITYAIIMYAALHDKKLISLSIFRQENCVCRNHAPRMVMALGKQGASCKAKNPSGVGAGPPPCRSTRSRARCVSVSRHSLGENRPWLKPQRGRLIFIKNVRKALTKVQIQTESWCQTRKRRQKLFLLGTSLLSTLYYIGQ